MSIGSPGLFEDAADEGKMGMLLERWELKLWELLANGLLFNGSPKEAIEKAVLSVLLASVRYLQAASTLLYGQSDG